MTRAYCNRSVSLFNRFDSSLRAGDGIQESRWSICALAISVNTDPLINRWMKGCCPQNPINPYIRRSYASNVGKLNTICTKEKKKEEKGTLKHSIIIFNPLASPFQCNVNVSVFPGPFNQELGVPKQCAFCTQHKQYNLSAPNFRIFCSCHKWRREVQDQRNRKDLLSKVIIQ